jgi:hypothetical protein
MTTAQGKGLITMEHARQTTTQDAGLIAAQVPTDLTTAVMPR